MKNYNKPYLLRFILQIFTDILYAVRHDIRHKRVWSWTTASGCWTLSCSCEQTPSPDVRAMVTDKVAAHV